MIRIMKYSDLAQCGMDYAVTLEFDEETQNKIQAMIDEVADVTGCDYMKN